MANKNETWDLAFEKGGCLDVCQAYTIRIESNGEFKYKGNFNVKHLGLITGTLKLNELIEVNELLKSINWEDVESKVDNNTNNAQLKAITYSTKTINKKITYYSSKFQSIRDLERYIDTIIDKDEL